MSTETAQKPAIVYEYQRILAWHKEYNPIFPIKSQFTPLGKQGSTSAKHLQASNTVIPAEISPTLQRNARVELKAKIRKSHQQIHQKVIAAHAEIVSRTAAAKVMSKFATF